MMKRVGFCGFKPLDKTRKMPFNLGFGGVNANGDRPPPQQCDPVDQLEATSHQRCARSESFSKKSDKGNILNVLRRKWRRSKRFKCRKRSESLLNMCHSSYPENCESMPSCAKHHRLKTQKSKSIICQSSSQVLQCRSCDELDSVETQDEISQNNVSVGNEETEDCSCFGSPNRKARSKTLSKTVKLKARASRSLSDISCTPDISSPSSKTDSESDICRITCSSKNTENSSYSNRLCIDSTEHVDSSFASKVPCDHCNNMGQKFGNLTQELYKLSKYGWYWGPINRSEAESKLIDQPDGAFLVRDSSDDRYILSLSFRSYGKTLHTRIEHSSGLFTFYSQPEPEGGLTSIVELIQQSMCYSQSGVFCYSRSRSPGSPSFPVRLTKPISRFTQVRSLQYLCRFVIRQYTRYDHIQELPLPSRIKGYLEEGHY